MVNSPISRVQVTVVEGGWSGRRPDRLVTEEPLEIRVTCPGRRPRPLVVTMRTPGSDFELAAGLLFTEGIVRGHDDIASITYCLGGDGDQQLNVVTVKLRVPRPLPEPRAFTVTASCGVCGKESLDQIAAACPPVGSGPSVAVTTLLALPDRLRASQSVFGETGGVHAAARFNREGALLDVREDVGRHNALDKLVGKALLEEVLPLSEEIILVSGRVSFELVQKAAMAGTPVLCAVSAPSSLAVTAADRLGVTVVGFLREDRCNVYTHPDRIEIGA